MIKKFIKCAIIVFALAASIFVVSRIVYINNVYPSTKIKMLSQNEALGRERIRVEVNDAVLYNNEQWSDYIHRLGIESASEPESAGMPVYELEDDYKVLVVDMNVTNLQLIPQHISVLRGDIRLISGTRSIPVNAYYSNSIELENKIVSKDIDPDETQNFLCVYIMKKDSPDEYMLEYFELGNNQRLKLDVKMAEN